jgi:hypothetical protein
MRRSRDAGKGHHREPRRPPGGGVAAGTARPPGIARVRTASSASSSDLEGNAKPAAAGAEPAAAPRDARPSRRPPGTWSSGGCTAHLPPQPTAGPRTSPNCCSSRGSAHAPCVRSRWSPRSSTARRAGSAIRQALLARPWRKGPAPLPRADQGLRPHDTGHEVRRPQGKARRERGAGCGEAAGRAGAAARSDRDRAIGRPTNRERRPQFALSYRGEACSVGSRRRNAPTSHEVQIANVQSWTGLENESGTARCGQWEKQVA